MTYLGSGGLYALHCGESAIFRMSPARYTTKENSIRVETKTNARLYPLLSVARDAYPSCVVFV